MTDHPISDLQCYAVPQPKMRGRYFMRHWRNAIAMMIIDASLRLVPVRRRQGVIDPQRILVANWAHLGDVIISTGVLRALRQRYPTAEIGMIVGPWAKAAIEHTGLIDHLHVIDQWRLDRSSTPIAEKKRRYRRSRKRTLAEIRHLSYDVGIDLLNLYPPAHPLFFRAGIPLRIGYTSGGFGPLLSRPIEWQDDDRAMADHYRDLLDAIDPARPFAPDAVQPRRAKAAVSGLPPELAHVGPYVVLHPGAGADFKDWGLSRWHELADRLRHDRPDLILVFTGAGQTELAMTAALAKDRPGTIDMAGRVDWEGFVSIVAHAALVICPDTATGHVAALFDVPTISLFTGTNKVAQWRPYSDQATVLVQPVLCSPCNRSGCEAMACLRQTTADDVMATVVNVLPPSDHR